MSADTPNPTAPQTPQTTKREQKDPPSTKKPPIQEPPEPEHEGATEDEIGDRRGPGPGFDQEPEREKDGPGVAES
jgi:hypothetical protein